MSSCHPYPRPLPLRCLIIFFLVYVFSLTSPGLWLFIFEISSQASKGKERIITLPGRVPELQAPILSLISQCSQRRSRGRGPVLPPWHCLLPVRSDQFPSLSLRLPGFLYKIVMILSSLRIPQSRKDRMQYLMWEWFKIYQMLPTIKALCFSSHTGLTCQAD